MVAPVDPQTGLARVFAEFALLSDLLALAEPGDGPPPSWRGLLDTEGFTVDHIYDEDMPPDADIPATMAEDAWRVAEWLELVGPDGLTPSGRVLALIADLEPTARTEAIWRPVENVLQDQIRAFYLGADGTNIVDLVQTAARTLETVEGEWASFCPGLLHVEFEALIYLAQTNPARAVALLDELEQNRADAMRDARGPFDGVINLLNMTVHADAVSLYYLDQLPAHVDDTVLSLTASQATALLFVFCGLLEAPEPMLPIQYLTVPSG